MNAIFAAISATLNIIPNKKLIGYGIRDQIKDVLPSLILSLLMYIIASPVVKLGYSDLITISLQIVLAIFVYVSGSYVLKVDSFVYIINTIKK